MINMINEDTIFRMCIPLIRGLSYYNPYSSHKVGIFQIFFCRSTAPRCGLSCQDKIYGWAMFNFETICGLTSHQTYIS
jgi:hypothetical protein